MKKTFHNFVIGYDVAESYQKKYDNIVVTFINVSKLVKLLQS
jgi:hypothetical protein